MIKELEEWTISRRPLINAFPKQPASSFFAYRNPHPSASDDKAASHQRSLFRTSFVMEEEANELKDWEDLSSFASGDDAMVIIGSVDDIRSDYFDSDGKNARPLSLPSEEEEEEEEEAVDDEAEEGGIDSENPSSKDPDPGSNRTAELRAEESNSDGEWNKKGSRNEMGLSPEAVSAWENSSSIEVEGKEKIGGEREGGNGLGAGGSCGEEERSRVAWWKTPFQLLGFFFVKLKPNWSISVAAAIVGFVILGRRLLRMRDKRRSSSVRFAVEGKKAPQLLAQASHLNEKLSTTRRVPVTSTFPATGVSQWPVVVLR